MNLPDTIQWKNEPFDPDIPATGHFSCQNRAGFVTCNLMTHDTMIFLQNLNSFFNSLNMFVKPIIGVMTCSLMNLLCVRISDDVLFYERSTRRSSPVSMKVSTPHTTIVAGLLVCLGAGCNSRSAVDQILTPTHMDFRDLFVQESIIRLDNSVLLGSNWRLNVNSKGELLILDIQSRGVHLFASDGALVQTMAIRDCYPETNFDFNAHASFLDDSHFVVLISKGAIIFGRNGECIQTITDRDLALNTWGLCSYQDTIFAMPRNIRDSTFIRAYSSDFALIDQFPLPVPKFQRRASIMLTMSTDTGSAMGCFDDDVWWVYSENFDATPRLSRSGLTRFMPDFFVERTQDFPDFGVINQSNLREITEQINKTEAEATSVEGMFALDNETRIIVYNNGALGLGKGAVIANHNDRFPAYSTRLEKAPEAAANGRLYIVSDLEDESIEEALNPTIARYRFVPPAGK